MNTDTTKLKFTESILVALEAAKRSFRDAAGNVYVEQMDIEASRLHRIADEEESDRVVREVYVLMYHRRSDKATLQEAANVFVFLEKVHGHWEPRASRVSSDTNPLLNAHYRFEAGVVNNGMMSRFRPTDSDFWSFCFDCERDYYVAINDCCPWCGGK